VVGAFATYLEALQLETTVTLYNQAATNLESIRAWWISLPANEKTAPTTVNRLVERSEEIMRAEHAGWVQQMQDAMTKLRLDAADARRDADAAEDGSVQQATGATPRTRTRSTASGKNGTTRRSGKGQTTASKNGSGNGTGRIPTGAPAGAGAQPTEAGGS